MANRNKNAGRKPRRRKISSFWRLVPGLLFNFYKYGWIKLNASNATDPMLISYAFQK